MGSNKKLVSVIVVCYNEEKNIRRCIQSLGRQSLGENSYEIIVVDNGSTDNTRNILVALQRQYRNMRVIVNPRRGISISRNIGVANAEADLVAFTDADCEVPRHWLNTLLKGYEKYKLQDPLVVAVGGSNSPPRNEKNFYDVLEVFLNSYLGSHGSVQGMQYSKDRYVPHIPTVNVLYERSAIINIGGFDEAFGNIGEDQDLSHRLRLLGSKFVYLADAGITHYLRNNWQSWVRNMFTYGKGRMWLLIKHPSMRKQFHFALPILLVLSTLSLPLTFVRLDFGLAILYFVAIFCISFFKCMQEKRLDLIWPLFMLYVFTHIAYGFGEIWGICHRPNMPFAKYSSVIIKQIVHSTDTLVSS